MPILKREVFGELQAAIVYEEGHTVEISQPGLEYKYSVSVSTIDAAIDELSRMLDWLRAIPVEHEP